MSPEVPPESVGVGRVERAAVGIRERVPAAVLIHRHRLVDRKTGTHSAQL